MALRGRRSHASWHLIIAGRCAEYVHVVLHKPARQRRLHCRLNWYAPGQETGTMARLGAYRQNMTGPFDPSRVKAVNGTAAHPGPPSALMPKGEKLGLELTANSTVQAVDWQRALAQSRSRPRPRGPGSRIQTFAVGTRMKIVSVVRLLDTRRGAPGPHPNLSALTPCLDRTRSHHILAKVLAAAF